jgi:nucleoid-associated protein YgaU
MKKVSILSAFFVMLLAGSVFAQYPEDFTKDQADSTIVFRRSQITRLDSDVKLANDQVAKAEADIKQRMADNTKCREDLYALCGTDRNGYNAYRERLARNEQEYNALKSMSAAQLGQNQARVDGLEQEIRYLREQKLVLIPDHRSRVASLSSGFMNMKRGMIPPNTMYTVGTWAKDRDCLWNIAKKPEMYNDPFAWPKIWRANSDQIKNPDLIYPGQQLTIPKTEVTEADKDMTGYRHRRR